VSELFCNENIESGNKKHVNNIVTIECNDDEVSISPDDISDQRMSSSSSDEHMVNISPVPESNEFCENTSGNFSIAMVVMVLQSNKWTRWRN